MEPSADIDLLHRLAATCRAGARCYRRGADEARRNELVDILERRASELAAAAVELEAFASAAGAPADAGGTTVTLPAADPGRRTAAGDAALLDACERAEDAAMSEYLAALDRPLAAPLRGVVEGQYDHIKHAHGEIRTLRDQARAAPA